MTKEQAVQKLKALQGSKNEQAFGDAISVLCELLISLGCQDVVAEFDKLDSD